MDQLRENYDAVLASPLKRMESALIGSRSSKHSWISDQCSKRGQCLE